MNEPNVGVNEPNVGLSDEQVEVNEGNAEVNNEQAKVSECNAEVSEGNAEVNSDKVEVNAPNVEVNNEQDELNDDDYITIQGIGAHVDQRLCVKHLYGNENKKYPSLELKKVMWVAAMATIIPLWERAMQKMKELNEGARKDMMSTSAQL